MFRFLEQAGVMVVQVGNLADLARKQVMEHTFRQQGIAEITRTGRCQTDTQIVEIVKVALQVLPCKAVRNPGKIVQHPLPVYTAQFRKFQQRHDLAVDLQKSDVRERKCTVCHNAFELHTQALRLIAHLHQVATPVDRCLRGVKHLLCHHPDFRYDLVGHHVVDTAVIVVFRAATPDTEVRECFVFQKFGRENSGCRHLRRRIVLQDVIDLLTVVAFSHDLRTERGCHCRHGTRIVVHAVILGVDMLREGKQQNCKDK